jgi:aquaporin Z
MGFPKQAAYITEFLGTFFLVLTVGLNLEVDNHYTGVTAPLAIGSILMCMIYMGGHISGAHYNPAITLGVYLRGNKITLRDTIAYIIVQNVAGFCAALVCYAITSVTFAPQPDADFSILKTLMVEFFYSFALVYVVLSTATTKSLGK